MNDVAIWFMQCSVENNQISLLVLNIFSFKMYVSRKQNIWVHVLSLYNSALHQIGTWQNKCVTTLSVIYTSQVDKCCELCENEINQAQVIMQAFIHVIFRLNNFSIVIITHGDIESAHTGNNFHVTCHFFGAFVANVHSPPCSQPRFHFRPNMNHRAGADINGKWINQK